VILKVPATDEVAVTLPVPVHAAVPDEPGCRVHVADGRKLPAGLAEASVTEPEGVTGVPAADVSVTVIVQSEP
jgi:hypothetical protein